MLPQQLLPECRVETFEIEAFLFLGNALHVGGHDRTPLDQARRAIDRRLQR